ncbi:glutathione S-transferase family protein [Corallococcus exiguus]|uniref:glutathione S-transferase family protein n=1 Tax=Corallococcus TaxID=83461 RepID=UPI000EC27791|nr:MULTISPECIES: glutathione S-transferase family protein [Corallococcus]NNC06797.1 glutathione S-transferase family protein [Corallococcus exiguus]NPC50317.1 glutathione S-transferase family protein [Corallococcus exiguus]RKH84990.1 glutathione S-transferase family protein [Corallococcus sp. AB032C]
MTTNTLPPLTLLELADPGLPGIESYSPFCLKAHRALKYAGLPYARGCADNPASHRAHNPTGQVPVLLVGAEAVPDSTAILARIQQLAPGRIDASPEALLWEELADTSLNGFLVASRWADDRNWPRTRATFFHFMPAPVRAVVPTLIRRKQVERLVARDVWRTGPEACWRRFGALLDQLDARAPEQGFWLSGALSVADLALFGQLHSFRTPLTPWQGAEVDRRERLSAWLGRVDVATRTASVPLRAAS